MNENRNYVKDANVFVTGGTGAFGLKFARWVLENGARKVTLFSRDEMKHVSARRTLADYGERAQCVIGDVLDFRGLSRAMSGHDIVVHAAAAKVLPECEKNVYASTRVNVNGTLAALEAFEQSTARDFIFLSTDKAPYASTAYGAQKYLAEKLVTEFGLRVSRPKRAWNLRYSNVIDSTGAVFLLFKENLQKDQVVSVNGESTFRGFVSQSEVIKMLNQTLGIAGSGDIFVLEPKVIKISDLALSMQKLIGKGRVEIKSSMGFVGEKESAQLIMKEEIGLISGSVVVDGLRAWVVSNKNQKVASGQWPSEWSDGLSLENCQMLNLGETESFVKPLL